MRHDVVNVSRLNVAIVSAGCAELTGALLCGVADAAGGTWLLDRAERRLVSPLRRSAASCHPTSRFGRRGVLVARPRAADANRVALGLAALMPRQDERRGRVLFYSLLTVGLVGSAWLSRLHAGAHPNVLMPATRRSPCCSDCSWDRRRRCRPSGMGHGRTGLHTSRCS